jgi:opacity protein-like surface antigen
MKKILPAFLVSFFLYQVIYSQTLENTGKPLAEIFTDFHYNFNDTAKTTGFGLNRAYLGYKFFPAGNFSSTIIINVASPEDLAEGSKPRRYAFFREASVTYSKEKLILTFGIASTRIFDYQQRFWGKRYIATEYQALYGYGFVADLGMVLDYKLNDILKVDLSVMNGEGYSNIQLDNNLKTSLGFTITPVNQLAIRLYGDIMRPRGLWQSTLVAFAGFKNDLITFGVEASYKSNLDLTEGHHVWGLSGTGSVKISEKVEIFGRCDFSSSVVMPNDVLKWNYQKDGSFVIAGVQYTFSSNFRLALDYQGTYPYAPAKRATDMIFVNAHFKF